MQLRDVLRWLYFDYRRVIRMVISWVDGIGVDVVHFDEMQAVQEACEVAEFLAQPLAADGLRISGEENGFLVHAKAC